MRHQKLVKQGIVLAMAAAMTIGSVSTAFAAGWKQNATGWWWENDDGSYPTYRWEWLDGNKDGVAECYYFDKTGYMIAGTTVDGFAVNADGQWTVDGNVQRKNVEVKKSNEAVNADGTMSTSEYDSNGISLAAMDMYTHTREENAKYGETKTLESLVESYVEYQNGIAVFYAKNRNGVVDHIAVSADDATKIFKYAKAADTADGLLKVVKAKGFYAYNNNETVWVKLPQTDGEELWVLNSFEDVNKPLYSVVLQ